MTSETDIANRALMAIGTRSQIASLSEDSPEARACNQLLEPLRDELLRLAPWGCATNYNNLALICAAPGTPENPTTGTTQWEKGIPPPLWFYEYAYPIDCLRALWIVPQLFSGFPGVPITTAVTGAVPQAWTGPAIRFKIAIDQVTDGLPAVDGTDTKVLLTNQPQAILCYIKRVTIPDVWDDQFRQAFVAALAARLAIPLTQSKDMAVLKLNEANGFIATARAGDGNEGLTINDVTPDWIRVRGIDYPSYAFPVDCYDWGPLLTLN